ncbi:IclR family transcriptional regulator [Virgisporangium aliadipatigenens]|uniref:IclR family transcriptional regulator n=1 Tax=Virgisporangium aliadipatigenens TaxID=741659 RepID=A0A8J3YZF6_9ACTN|nr:helix-turn-helix domain-containing protein [Virgisporangium aliadipatigenens]GIJ52388.1 IclR family transcriptional regulator [Virgisporangium aliadipatigenens]
MADGRSVIDGAFRLLRALPDAGAERQVARLTMLTGLPRPTVHRLLGQLAEAGSVEWRDGRWVLAAGLIELAQRVEPLAGLRRTASTLIQEVREQTGAAVSLVVPGGDAFVALEMLPGRAELPIAAHAGVPMPASTAAGIALTGAPGPRCRPFGAAVDDQDSFEGMTCYAVRVELPGLQRAALQIATSSARPAERSAALVHRAAIELQRRLSSMLPADPNK